MLCHVCRAAEERADPALFPAPIPTTEPMKGEPSLEIPEIEAKRAGLDLGIRIWLCYLSGTPTYWTNPIILIEYKKGAAGFPSRFSIK